jgi:hypothetical protein
MACEEQIFQPHGLHSNCPGAQDISGPSGQWDVGEILAIEELTNDVWWVLNSMDRFSHMALSVRLWGKNTPKSTVLSLRFIILPLQLLIWGIRHTISRPRYLLDLCNKTPKPQNFVLKHSPWTGPFPYERPGHARPGTMPSPRWPPNMASQGSTQEGMSFWLEMAWNWVSLWSSAVSGIGATGIRQASGVGVHFALYGRVKVCSTRPGELW